MLKVKSFLLELLQLALTFTALIIVVVWQSVAKLLQAAYTRQQAIFDPDNTDE